MKYIIISTIIFLVTISGLVESRASNVIYDDSLNPSFSDYSWGTSKLQNLYPVYEGLYSIKFTAKNFDGLYFAHHQNIPRENFAGISFYVNPGTNLSPHINLKFASESQVDGPEMKLISKSNPSQSACGVAELPAHKWTRCFVPIPSDNREYNGFKIISATSQADDIYIDKIEGVTMDQQAVRPQYPSRRVYPVSEKVTQASSIILPGAQFSCSDAQADLGFGGSGGGHSFWTSQQLPYLDNQRLWSFYPAGAQLTVQSDGNIQIRGVLYPTGLGPYSSNLWYCNLEFSPVPNPGMGKDELLPEAYVPFGPIDPNSWAFFNIVPENSWWMGAASNFNKRVYFTGMEFNMPLQIGYGANGKNGNLGLSVWLTFATGDGHIGSVPMDMNLDLLQTKGPVKCNR